MCDQFQTKIDAFGNFLRKLPNPPKNTFFGHAGSSKTNKPKIRLSTSLQRVFGF